VLTVVYLDARENAAIRQINATTIGDLTQWVWYKTLGIMGACAGIAAWVGLIGSVGTMWLAWGRRGHTELSPGDRRALAFTFVAVITAAAGTAFWFARRHWF
jgi:hypothetical protein